MSNNFFAALDDSGDEAPAPSKSNIKKREPKNAKKADDSASDSKAVSGAPKGDSRRKPNNNNDRNTKSGRGGRAPTRDGKRAYDRRSGTGRGKEIKKGGGGARNWGSDKAEAKQMEGKINEDEVKEEKPVQEAIDGVGPAEGEEAPVQEKPEAKTMTYAEYMASKGEKEEKVRETENEFKGVAASAKVEEDFLVMGGGKQKKIKKKKEGEKKTVDVGFRVAAPNAGDDREGDRGGRGGRGRGDRGGRGGRGSRDGRGRGRGRGGGRGSKNAGINVQDEAAFPSL